MRVPRLINESMRGEFLCLLKNFAYSKKEVMLASGQKSNFYIDCKHVSFRPDGARALGCLFFEIMQSRENETGRFFDACAGMALGAVPISVALMMEAFSKSRLLPSLCVRKEQKDHGSKACVEGVSDLAQKSHVLLVEDVITTGQSTINAALALRSAGFEVSEVIAIVDRQAGGEKNLDSQGLHLQSLFNLSDF